MSKQADEDQIVPPAKTGIDRGAQTNKFGIFLSIVAVIIAAAAFGFTYVQMTKQDATLTQQVAALKQQTGDDATQLQSLTHSIQQLQQASANDNQDVITAIYTRLIAVNAQIGQLPVPVTPLQQDVTPAPVVDETDMSWWQKGLNRSLQALRQIVIIRYNENKTAPLILPEERHFLYQNLHAEMQNAIWAVLHRNPTVYHTSLARVTNWVQQYFVQQAPATSGVLQELTALQSVNVQSQDSNKTGA